MARWKSVICIGLGAVCMTATVYAQAPAPETTAPQVRPGVWRNTGKTPCIGPWGGIYECPPAPTTVAIRAGRMFDSVAGQMLTKQVIIITGEKIVDVGPGCRLGRSHGGEPRQSAEPASQHPGSLG